MAMPSSLAILLQRYGKSLPMSPQALSQLPQLPPQQSPPQVGQQTVTGPAQAPTVTPVDPSQMTGPAFTPGPQSVLGGLFQYDPSQDMGSEANGGNRLGILGATLKDVGADLGGRPEDANNIYQMQTRLKALQQKAAQLAAVKRLGDAKTPEDRQKAFMDLYSSGGDVGGAAAVLKSGQPTYVDPGENGKVGIDPFSGLPTGQNIQGVHKPTPNQPFNPDGTPNTAYQQYEADKQKASQAPAWANVDLARQRLDADKEDAGGGLSDAAKVNAAVKFNLTGTMPAFGMGKAARGDRLEVMNYAAQLATGKKTPEQLVSDAANYKALSGSLNQQTKQFNSIEQNANTAKNSINLALQVAKDGGTGPTDSPVFNRWVQAGRVAINGDPKVQSLQNHLSAFSEDYAKVMTANTSAAGATDRAASEAYKRISAANSYGNMQQIAGEMLKEMGGRHYAARAQITGIQSQLGGGAYQAPSGVQAPPPSPANLPRLPTSNPATDALLRKYGVTK